MKRNLVLIGDEAHLAVETKCEPCGEYLRLYPKKSLTTTTWTDYDGNRTTRVTVEFEQQHVCGGRGERQ